jgi:hypothetical protein
MLKNWVSFLLIGLIVATVMLALVLRLHKIDTIPYGYHVDELSDAVTVECLGTEGVDAHNNRYPLFGQLNYGTPKPATYMYPAVLWGKVFNYSVPSLRSLSVWFHFLGIGGLFLLARLLLGSRFALWVVFAAVVSCWLWVSSRVAFESLFAPTFFIWGLYFFFRRQNYLHWAIAGLFFALAMYSYPPMRLQLPLMLVTLFVYSLRKMKFSVLLWVVLTLCMVVPLIPMVQQILKGGEIQQRFNSISIAAPEYLKSLGKTNSSKDLLGIFIDNYKQHLSPDFLLFKGDPSLIHSSGHFGILSWLDMAALILCIGSLLMLLIKPLRKQSPWAVDAALLLLIIMNIFLGIVPSAFTNSELPNSLRIVGSWPFLCLLTGYFMWQLERWWWPLGLAVLLAGVLYFVSFSKMYFGTYQEESKGMFSFWTLDQANAAKTEDDWHKFMLMYRHHDYHFRYYLMHYRKDTCISTRQKWFRQAELLHAMNIFD